MLKELDEKVSGSKYDLQQRLRRRQLKDELAAIGVIDNNEIDMKSHYIPARVCVLLTNEEINDVKHLFLSTDFEVFENEEERDKLLATCASDWKDDTTITYSAWEDKDSASSNVLRDYTISIKSFVEMFCDGLPYLAAHKATVMQQRFALIVQEKGLLPHQLQLTLDFIENMKINTTSNEIQSAHWATVAVTIFAAVVRVVDFDIWNDITGNLNCKEEVLCETIDGNFEAGIVEEIYNCRSESKQVKIIFCENMFMEIG